MSDESAVKEVVVEVQSPLNDDDAAADAAVRPGPRHMSSPAIWFVKPANHHAL